jgi:hypothetical protein
VSLHLPDESAYRAHFITKYTRSPHSFRLSTGTAPVYFAAHSFDHAFFESTLRDGAKDEFSLQRAQRMDDIATALADPNIERRAGWDKRRKSHHHSSCVTLAVEDFVVIVRLGLTKKGFLKGNFVTCYVADNSINKIRNAPVWDQSICMQELIHRNGR